jgi:thiaminase
MQQITQEINHQVRTRSDLAEMNQAFNRVVVMEHDFS